MDWLIGEFKKDQGIDLSGDKTALQRLKEAAEKVKIELPLFKRRRSTPFITADSSGQAYEYHTH